MENEISTKQKCIKAPFTSNKKRDRIRWDVPTQKTCNRNNDIPKTYLAMIHGYKVRLKLKYILTKLVCCNYFGNEL